MKGLLLPGKQLHPEKLAVFIVGVTLKTACPIVGAEPWAGCVFEMK